LKPGTLDYNVSTADRARYLGESQAYEEFVFGTATNSTSGDTTDESESENKLYLREKCAPPKTDPITWWKENTFRFPSLSRMARDYLSVPGTSVPAEEVFSTAGDIVSKKRNRLVGENIRMLMLPKSWLGLDMYEEWEIQEENHGEDAGYVADIETFKLTEDVDASDELL
jgi:hAT family C-terminal dimerisation region